MKKLTIIKRIGLILAIVIMIPPLLNFALSIPYYSDIEKAIEHKSRSKSYVHMATIIGKEGTVYIGFGDHNTICAYNFHTKAVNGDILYKVAKEIGL
ncbi:MAG: hypothetical protein FWG06_02170, partial [Clostridiales bacterium]|nr:hypothetical protein [Clostridiales bacterium]